MSLTEAIAANNATLSTLSIPCCAENKAVAGKADVVAAVLEYHVLNGTFPASRFTKEAQFVPRFWTNLTYTQVTGGQVVQVVLDGSNAVVTTGLKEKSKTTQTDIMFTGGVMHIIDTVLTIPLSPAVSTRLYQDVTIFAPSNEAFEKIGNTVAALPVTQLIEILKYHVINGTVGYSTFLTTGLANESLPTLMGQSLTVYRRKLQSLHQQRSIVENPTATTQPIAYEGATSAPNAPFTSGITATTTAPSAATGTNDKTGAGERRAGVEGLGGVVVAVVGAAVMLL
ncbi:hypothetical protein DID88_000920 [Monilinia fructigena]|uniref:FAS1 domain-containing protein n=1 Tax=Monilinia fructigena TaxID=38457 RepID=A0A395IYL7_9HELO|nr:hypothetical protein DID88_000920 [Monilinia fructigena]